MNLNQTRDRIDAIKKELVPLISMGSSGDATMTTAELGTMRGLTAELMACQAKATSLYGEQHPDSVGSSFNDGGEAVISGRLKTVNSPTSATKGATSAFTKSVVAEARSKAFTVSGSIAVESSLFAGIASKPRAMRFASELLGEPETVPPGDFSYLSQTTRTNNAAPVALGALKPTSVYGIERVTSPVETIAHLSDPIPRQHLEDEADLARFIESEMRFGLLAALDAQVIGGDGSTPNLEGIFETSGVQAQPFDTSALISTRKALTKLQTADVIADTDDTDGLAYVVAPADWEALELLTATGGEFILNNGPVNAAERRLWGVPVVVSSSVSAGTALLGHWPAARLVSRGPVVVSWTEAVDDDFTKNLVRFRCEGRFGVGVVQPTAFVEIATVSS